VVLKRARGAIAQNAIAWRRGFSLRTILVVPFVLQLCLAVGVTNWLSWRNGQQAIEKLAFSLQSETAERVQLKLANHLETPVLISRLNGEAWRNGQIDFNNLASSEDYLIRQLIQFQGVSNIVVANAGGEMRAVSREGMPRLLGTAPGGVPEQSAEYQLSQGDQSQPISQRFEQFDIRQVDWYQAAAEGEGLVWTTTAAALGEEQLGIDRVNGAAVETSNPAISLQASLPLFDATGQLSGIVSSGISADNLKRFLAAMELNSGQVFILGPVGQIVASSQAQPSEPEALENTEIDASEAQSDELIDTAIANLQLPTEGIDKQSSPPRQFIFQPQQPGHSGWQRSQRQFISILPLDSRANQSALSQLSPVPTGDRDDLNWQIVIATPEEAFTRQLRENRRTTLALSTIALLGAIALGLATANWLARPIMRLSRTSQAIARGKLKRGNRLSPNHSLGQGSLPTPNSLEQTLLAESLDEQAPIREVATLARSFNQMTQRLRRAFDSLETQVDRRTQQLQQSFEFEATLKRLTDRVRDSLNEDEILHRAVEELAIALGVRGCNAAIYDLERQTSTVKYEYTTFHKRIQGSILDMNNFAGYRQLVSGQYFQYCGTIAVPSRGQVTMLACPIRDDQGVLGDLWLIKPAREAFSDREIRLVQQVANQCAIAIRQARLYQTAQGQVAELGRLNQLKDDFLSTVSHELRTPMANMKMALQMLEISRQRQAQANSTTQNSSAAPDPSQRYFAILKEAVQRESTLIENLLDLSRIHIQSAPPQLSTIEPRRWLKQIVQPYYEKHGDRLRWQLFLPDYLPLLQTDADYLQRILMELLDNACKYTPDGESITVSVQLEQGWLSFSIGNSGTEISPVEQRRIFERFYRIPTSDPWKHGGTGLGLALVRQLSERLGGQAQVESNNQQTLFTVSFPLALERE